MPKRNRSEKSNHTKKATTGKIPKEIQQALAQPMTFFFWNVSGIVEYIHEGMTKTRTLNIFHRSIRPMVLTELEQANLKLYATFQERAKKEFSMKDDSPDLEIKSITMLAVSYLGTFTQEQWREGIQMPQEATQQAPQTTEQLQPAVTPAT